MALANDGEKDGRRRFCFEKSLDLIRGLEVRGGRLIKIGRASCRERVS